MSARSSKKKKLQKLESSEKIPNPPVTINFNEIVLNQYWPKKLLFILFVIESNENCSEVIDNLVKVSKNYEDLSSLSFISRSDVIKLLNSKKSIILPKLLESVASEIIENGKQFCTEKLPNEVEAQLIKLRLIQQLNKQYVKEIGDNEKNKNFANLLSDLSKDSGKNPKKDGKGKVKDTKKKNKKDKKIVGSSTNLHQSALSEKDSITSTENVFNNIWFYCITGIRSVEIMRILIEQLNVPISGVIQIGKYEADGKDKICNFWNTVTSEFFSNTSKSECFENTGLMKFIPDEEQDIFETFQELLYVIRSMIDIRLTHLKYIENISLHTVKNVYPTVSIKCMRNYDKCLKYLPVEYVNSAVILDALLTQTDSTLNDSIQHAGRESLIEPVPSSTSTIISNFTSSQTLKLDQNYTDISDFLVHENNELQKIFKFYKQKGFKIFSANFNVLKLFPIFGNIPDTFSKQINGKNPARQSINKNQLDDFKYLFLFNSFSDQPKNYDYFNDNSSFIKHLIAFNREAYNMSLQAVITDGMETNDRHCFNLYNPSVILHHWKEEISNEIILQALQKALKEFSYLEWKYSPESNNFLLIFSDKLDEFGKHSKIFHEIVRTPICLRDFCRYTCLNDSEWINENRIETVKDKLGSKIKVKETCPGSDKINTTLKLFEEYSYLLDTEGTNADKVTTEITQEETNYEEIMRNLENYPCNKDLVKRCGKSIDKYSLISYDLGSNLFALSGHQTTFYSHDGIKVLIDNTKFVHESPKCSVKISCNGNDLIAYSSEKLTKETYIINLILEDETRISFVLNGIREKTQKIEDELETIENKKNEVKNEIDEIVGESDDTMENIELEELKNDDEFMSPKSEDQLVHCIDQDHFKELLGEGYSLSDCYVNDDLCDLADAIINAKENNGTIFKIRPKFHHLKSINSTPKLSVHYPLQHILTQLEMNSSKWYEKYSKRYGSPENKEMFDNDWPVDFRLCLPNGLFMRVCPVSIKDIEYLIKQEYTNGRPKDKIALEEEFRLWSNRGFVLVKRIDATIRILKSNGEIIDFENDPSEELDNPTRRHSSTLHNYEKKYRQMLKEDQQDLEFLSSRETFRKNKPVRILDEKLLKLMQKLNMPYSKITLTTFDGKKIQMFNNKLTYFQAHHLVAHQDLASDQTLCERTDGFRSNLDSNGTQQILFSDDTRIETCLSVANDLVDDFVMVNLTTKYDHPYYITVKFAPDDDFEAILKNGTSVKGRCIQKDFSVQINGGINLSVSENEVNVEKQCPNCKGSCWCKLDLSPFDEGVWSPDKIFLHIEDTYNKQFSSDYLGNCFANSDCLFGPLNKFKCNHVQGAIYKKLFIVNKDLSGQILWMNEQVEKKIKESKEDLCGCFSSYRSRENPNTEVVDCRKKHYETYLNRFYNKNLSISGFTSIHNPKVAYCTFRVFHRMFNTVEEIKQDMFSPRNLSFYNSLESANVYKILAKFAQDFECYEKMNKSEEDEFIVKKCGCIKQKTRIDAKIQKWKLLMKKFKKIVKNPDVPCYFESDFYKISES